MRGQVSSSLQGVCQPKRPAKPLNIMAFLTLHDRRCQSAFAAQAPGRRLCQKLSADVETVTAIGKIHERQNARQSRAFEQDQARKPPAFTRISCYKTWANIWTRRSRCKPTSLHPC